MYSIYADGELLYYPSLEGEGYAVLSPKVEVEMNKAGSATFQIPPDNAMYNDLHKLKSEIIINDEDEEIFRGRVLHDEKGFYNIKDVYCEGELAYLLDSRVRPYSFHGSVKDLVKQYLESHNSQVDPWKQFNLGDVTVTDQNDYIVRESSDYPKSFDEMQDKLVNLLGGYIRPRLTDGVRYLDYVTDYGSVSDQVIEFGKNLLDISEYISAEDVFTVLIPLGAEQQDANGNSTGRLTISSVNGGKDYIEDADAIKLFGRIVKVETWDDVTVASNLLTKGKNHLAKGIEMAVSLRIKAVDLHLIDVDVKRIKLGDQVRVVSLPHGLDKYFLCSKISYDLVNPKNTEYTFGVTFTTLTDKQTNQQKTVQNNVSVVQSYAKSAQNSANQANNAVNEVEHIITQIPSDYVKKIEFEKNKLQMDEKIDAISKKLTQQQNGLQSNPISAVCHLIDVCNTYVGNKELWYGNYNTAFNQDCTKGERKNGTEDVVKYRIDCSSFAMLALRGIPFENSRYKNDENTITSGYVFDEDTEYNKNRKYGGGGLLANELAKYAYEHNFLRRFYAYTQEDISTKRVANPEWEDDVNADIVDDVHAGDLIFFRNSSTKGYWQNIGHVAVVVDVKNNFLHCYEATSTIYIDTDDGKDYFAVGYSIYKKSDLKNKDIQFFARFPLQESDPADVFPVNIANINDNVSDSDTNFKINGKYLVVSADNLTSQLIYRVNIYPKLTGIYTASSLLEEENEVNAYVWDIENACRAKSPDGKESKTDTGGGTKVYMEAGKTYRLNTRINTGKTFNNLKCLPMVYPGVISRKEIGYTGTELSIFDVIERLNKAEEKIE